MAKPSFIQRVAAAAKGFASGGAQGSRRMMFPAQRRGYEAANYDRLTMDWSAPLTTGDAEMRTRLRTIRGRARELERNDPYTIRYLTCLENNIYDHHGITLQSKAADIAGRDAQTKKPLIKDIFCGANLGPLFNRIIGVNPNPFASHQILNGDHSFNRIHGGISR
jgi:hypothetical protein